MLDSEWGDVQPKAADENAYLEKHSWEEYAAWHLGLTEGANDETKARYAFVCGDFRRLHRMGLVACLYRAAEWRHKEVDAGRPRPAAGARRGDRLMDLDAVRRELEARRAGASERVAGLAKPPELGEAQGFGKRIGDGTTEAISRLTDIGVGRTLEAGLERTDRALAKLDEGTYGHLRQLRQADPRAAARGDARQRAVRGVRRARGAAAAAAAPPLEQDLGERAVVVDRRRAVAERLQADVVGAGVEVRLDDLGDLPPRCRAGSPRRSGGRCRRRRCRPR